MGGYALLKIMQFYYVFNVEYSSYPLECTPAVTSRLINGNCIFQLLKWKGLLLLPPQSYIELKPADLELLFNARV